MKIFGIILLAFVSCYGMPQDGPPSEFSNTKIATDGVKSIGDALKELGTEEGLLKELVNTGTTSSFFKRLSAFTGILGNSFAAAKFFTDLAFGSFEAKMFQRVFKEFKILNDEIKSLRAFAKQGFNQVIGSVWEAQRVNPLAKLDTASDIYDNYMKNPKSRSQQNKVISLFISPDIRNSINSLKRAIPNFSQTNFVKKGKCQELLLEKGNLMSLLSKAYMAHRLGCVLNNKINHGKNKKEATADCLTHLLPNLESQIFNVIDDKIKECKSPKNAKKLAKDFIKREIRDSDSIVGARDKIKTFMNDKFSYLTWMVNVYSPHSGFDKHTTNADITEFRLYDKMNIALSIMDSCRNYPYCKTDPSDCPIVPSPPRSSERRCVKFDGNSDWNKKGTKCFDYDTTPTWDARKFYDEAKKGLDRKGVRSYRLTVFRYNRDDDDDYKETARSPPNNKCFKQLNQNGDDFRISYVYRL